MEFESLRVAIAVGGCAAGAYFDLANNRNVPNLLLYAMLALGVVFGLAAWGQGSALSFAVAIAIFLCGYALYKMGQLGGADVYVLCAIALLLPSQPQIFKGAAAAPYPYVFSVIAASGISFMLYMIAFYGVKAVRAAVKERMRVDVRTAAGAVLVAAAYVAFVYVARGSGVFGFAYFALVGFVVFVSLFFMVFKERIARMMVEEIPLSRIEEEDVLALEYMDGEVVKKYKLARVANATELKRLAGLPIKKYCVYTKMPPFLPHILAGLLFTLYFGDVLMLIARA